MIDPIARMIVVLQEFDLNARFIGMMGNGPITLEIVDRSGEVIGKDTHKDRDVLVNGATDWVLYIYGPEITKPGKVSPKALDNSSSSP